MGMDLVPRTGADGIHLNWSGWRWFCEACERWGVPTDTLAGSNDGYVIPQDVCALIADAIEAHKDEYNQAFAGEYHGPDPASKHVRALRGCGGMEQW